MKLDSKGRLSIFFFEISSFLLQSNSACVVASAAKAVREIVTS